MTLAIWRRIAQWLVRTPGFRYLVVVRGEVSRIGPWTRLGLWLWGARAEPADQDQWQEFRRWIDGVALALTRSAHDSLSAWRHVVALYPQLARAWGRSPSVDTTTLDLLFHRLCGDARAMDGGQVWTPMTPKAWEMGRFDAFAPDAIRILFDLNTGPESNSRGAHLEEPQQISNLLYSPAGSKRMNYVVEGETGQLSAHLLDPDGPRGVFVLAGLRGAGKSRFLLELKKRFEAKASENAGVPFWPLVSLSSAMPETAAPRMLRSMLYSLARDAHLRYREQLGWASRGRTSDLLISTPLDIVLGLNRGLVSLARFARGNLTLWCLLSLFIVFVLIALMQFLAPSSQLPPTSILPGILFTDAKLPLSDLSVFGAVVLLSVSLAMLLLGLAYRWRCPTRFSPLATNGSSGPRLAVFVRGARLGVLLAALAAFWVGSQQLSACESRADRCRIQTWTESAAALVSDASWIAASHAAPAVLPSSQDRLSHLSLVFALAVIVTYWILRIPGRTRWTGLSKPEGAAQKRVVFSEKSAWMAKAISLALRILGRALGASEAVNAEPVIQSRYSVYGGMPLPKIGLRWKEMAAATLGLSMLSALFLLDQVSLSEATGLGAFSSSLSGFAFILTVAMSLALWLLLLPRDSMLLEFVWLHALSLGDEVDALGKQAPELHPLQDYIKHLLPHIDAKELAGASEIDLHLAMRDVLEACSVLFGRVVLLLDDVDILESRDYPNVLRALRPLSKVSSQASIAAVMAVPLSFWHAQRLAAPNDVHSTVRDSILLGPADLFTVYGRSARAPVETTTRKVLRNGICAATEPSSENTVLALASAIALRQAIDLRAFLGGLLKDCCHLTLSFSFFAGPRCSNGSMSVEYWFASRLSGLLQGENQQVDAEFLARALGPSIREWRRFLDRLLSASGSGRMDAWKAHLPSGSTDRFADASGLADTPEDAMRAMGQSVEVEERTGDVLHVSRRQEIEAELEQSRGRTRS